MDAAGLLKRQGWRGDGHALSHTGNGLKKPLLVSKKVDVLGLGVNKHAAVSDQWWMRAFDQGLKDLGTGKKGVLGNIREKGIVHGGLYGRFVKGEGVPGTFDIVKQQEANGEKKRKRGGDDDGSEAKRLKKLEKKARREAEGKNGTLEKEQAKAESRRKRKHEEGQGEKARIVGKQEGKAASIKKSKADDADTADTASVIDAEGKVRFTCSKHEPVPLDPTIWEGIDITTLPKAVRKARREWMSQQRQTQKSGESKRTASDDQSKSEQKTKRDASDAPKKVKKKELGSNYTPTDSSRKDRTKKSKKS